MHLYEIFSVIAVATTRNMDNPALLHAEWHFLIKGAVFIMICAGEAHVCGLTRQYRSHIEIASETSSPCNQRWLCLVILCLGEAYIFVLRRGQTQALVKAAIDHYIPCMQPGVCIFYEASNNKNAGVHISFSLIMCAFISKLPLDYGNGSNGRTSDAIIHLNKG
jgi:hypothetical protein